MNLTVNNCNKRKEKINKYFIFLILINNGKLINKIQYDENKFKVLKIKSSMFSSNIKLLSVFCFYLFILYLF